MRQLDLYYKIDFGRSHKTDEALIKLLQVRISPSNLVSYRHVEVIRRIVRQKVKIRCG
jgi:hypothetical protein